MWSMEWKTFYRWNVDIISKTSQHTLYPIVHAHDGPSLGPRPPFNAPRGSGYETNDGPCWFMHAVTIKKESLIRKHNYLFMSQCCVGHGLWNAKLHVNSYMCILISTMRKGASYSKYLLQPAWFPGPHLLVLQATGSWVGALGMLRLYQEGNFSTHSYSLDRRGFKQPLCLLSDYL